MDKILTICLIFVSLRSMAATLDDTSFSPLYMMVNHLLRSPLCRLNQVRIILKLWKWSTYLLTLFQSCSVAYVQLNMFIRHTHTHTQLFTHQDSVCKWVRSVSTARRTHREGTGKLNGFHLNKKHIVDTVTALTIVWILINLFTQLSHRFSQDPKWDVWCVCVTETGVAPE